MPIFSIRGSFTRIQPVSGRVLPLIVVADIASAGFCCTSAMNGVSNAAARRAAARRWSNGRMLAGFAETDRLQVLAPRRQHVGRVQRFLVAFLQSGMQEVGQNRQNKQPTARKPTARRVNGNEPKSALASSNTLASKLDDLSGHLRLPTRSQGSVQRSGQPHRSIFTPRRRQRAAPSS